MATWHGIIFNEISKLWWNLRKFAYQNRSVFEIIFICLYAIEQFSLIWFTFNIRNLQELAFIVSVFAIIVLTTFALHKILMESRIKLLEEDIKELLWEKFSLQFQKKQIIERYKELIESYKKPV